MLNKDVSRRELLRDMAVVGGTVMMGAQTAGSAATRSRGKLHLACNQYSWLVFYQREGLDFNQSLDTGLADVAASGLDGFEPGINSPDDIDRLAPLLKKHGLEMRSLYVNSTLHDTSQTDKSIEEILAIAKKARQIGTQIIVTNPSPIRWGGPENKNDTQLEVQAKALDTLGAKVKSMGLRLAYHNHDIELRNAAREFHHAMLGTDPVNVTLCLDAHWVYRGSGNSAVALFDILKLYGPRITELHLRQSAAGIWSETFSDGDIDYRALAKYLLTIGVKPLLVLEQAVESGTPKTMKPLDAFRKSSQYAREVFAGFADRST